MKNALVSIIIPYFNKKSTIERCVQSVINQNYTNWEIWIVDDKSDKELEILEAWEKYPIFLLRNEKNLGSGLSRQRAMEISNGVFFAFLDADDWWDPAFLEFSLNLMKTNDYSLTFTYCQTISYYSNGEIRQRKNNDINHTKIRESLIKYGHSWSTSSLLWNKQFCAKWKNLSTNQDSLFEFDSSLINNKIAAVNKVLCFKDETTGNNRVNLVKREEMIRNRFFLYKYIFKNSFYLLANADKIVLINRLIWTIRKLENTGHEKLISKYKIINYILIKTSKILLNYTQKTRFKIFVGQ